MLFKSIIGQNEVKKHLIRSVREKRIGHAQLFLGQEGSGNLALAIAFAQYINCTDKQEDDSCGKCVSCLKFEKLIHPDLHFVFPVANTKSGSGPAVSNDFIKEWRETVLKNPYFGLNEWYAFIGMENKQGNIGKDESESIVRKLSLKTFEGEYKIMVIWMAEKMNESCANKILKILEEPSDNTLFILVSESTEQILPTILSRTQLLKIPRLQEDEILTELEKKFGKERTEFKNIAHIANGNFSKALYLTENQEPENENHVYFIELMRISYKKNVIEIMPWVDKVSALGREGLKTFFEYALHMVRENYLMNYNLDKIVYLNDVETSFSKNFHIFIKDENINQLVEEFTQAYIHIERNAYNKIVLLDMALKLFALINPRKIA